MSAAAAEIATLRREVEELRKDRDRLDWLEGDADSGLLNRVGRVVTAYHQSFDATVRTAIDYCRKCTPNN